MTLRSLLQALALHAIVALLLVFSFEFTPVPEPPPKVNIVKAVSVDKAAVEIELKRLADQEQAKKDAEKKKQQELERKADEAKKKRQAEERKLAEIKKKKEQEIKKKKEAEQKRKQIEKEKKELEKQRQLEVEKKKKAEAEKKKQEEEKKRKEAARKAEQERLRKEEEERKRLETEKALQEALEAEQRALQEQQDLTEIQKYSALIARAVERRFNKLNLPEGLSCEILIRLLEGGKVAEASIAKSSGNELFDKRAETAVYGASPLPAPEEQRVFNKMRTIQILFRPKN